MMPSSSELSLLAQQLDELSGRTSSHKRGRRGAKTDRIGEIDNEQEEASIETGARVETKREDRCASPLGSSRSRSSSRRSSRGGSSGRVRGDASSYASSSEQPKWTATSLLRFFSNSRLSDKKKSPSPAEERENGSSGNSFASAADLRLVRQAAAAAAERCFPGAPRSLSPCLAPYYSPVLHPFWIAQEENTLESIEKEEEADENESEEEEYMNSYRELASTVPALLAADNIDNAGAIRAARLRGRSSSRRRKFLSTHRTAARSRRRCRSQRELLQQELPQQSPEAAAAAAAALLSCNSFNSYRIATVVPPAPGRGTWSGETNLGELLPLLLPEQYETQKEEQQQLQQMLLPLQQERKPIIEKAIQDLMHQEQQMSLLPQEIYDLSAFPTAAEPKAAEAAAPAAVGTEGVNEKSLQLPLTTKQLVALLQGRSMAAPGEAGKSLYNKMSSTSMPADLIARSKGEEETDVRRQASADMCDRRMENRSDVLSRAFVSASFAAAAATAEAEAERAAAQPIGNTLQQPQLKVRFEQQELFDEETHMEELPTAMSSSRLLLGADGIGERARVPTFAHADDIPGAACDAAAGTESDDTGEFPYTSRTPVAATLAADAAAADAAAAAKREAASLSAACDAVGRVKLQQVWGAAAVEHQHTRLLEELQRQQKQQRIIEAEVEAIDGLHQELDAWQADLKHHHRSLLQPAQQQRPVEQHRQQQLTKQQQVSNAKLQQLQHVQEQQDPLMDLHRRLLRQQHAKPPGEEPDIPLTSAGELYFAETRKLSTQEAEKLHPLVQDNAQEQQKKRTVMLLQHDNTTSPAVASTCSAAAVTDSAAVAADSVSSVVAAGITSASPATAVTHDAARAADVVSSRAGGLVRDNMPTAGAARTGIAGSASTGASAASAVTCATTPLAASFGKPYQHRSLSRPQPHSGTERSLSAAAKFRRRTLTTADNPIASSRDMPQAPGSGSPRAATADNNIVSTLQSSKGQTHIFSCSRQPQLQQQQQQHQKQQQKELQHPNEPRQGHVRTQLLPAVVQQQMGSEGTRNVSLTAPTAAVKTASQAYTVAATATGSAAADDTFRRHGSISANTDGVSARADYASTFPASDVPHVVVPSALGADAALTKSPPIIPVSEAAVDVGRASVSDVNGTTAPTAAECTTGVPFLPLAPSVKLIAKRPHQQVRAEEQLYEQQHQKQRPQELQQSQQQLPQQQRQPSTAHTHQLQRRENQQYILQQQPTQHLQQTRKETTVYLPSNVKSGTPQTATHTITQRSIDANESTDTLPLRGRGADNLHATKTSAPAVYNGHPAGATVIRKWRIINGVPTPVVQSFQPAFIGAGPGVVVGTSAPSSVSAAARRAPFHLATPVAFKSVAATAAKPIPEKKFSLFEKLRLLLGGGSSSSCTECVCSSGAASTTGRVGENELQQSATAARAVIAPAPPLPLVLPQDQQRQTVFMQWQLPHQQRVQQQQQKVQQRVQNNNMMPQELSKGEKRHHHTAAHPTASVAAGAEPTCSVPLSYPSVLFPSTSKVPPSQDVVELHATQCNNRSHPRTEGEIQHHNMPVEYVIRGPTWQEQLEGGRLILAPSHTHADVSARGPPTGYAVEAPSSAPPVAPTYIPSVVNTGVPIPFQDPSSWQTGRELKTHRSSGVDPQVFPPAVFAASSRSAGVYQSLNAATHPTGTAVSSAAIAGSAAPCAYGGVNATGHVESEQPLRRHHHRSRSAVPIAVHPAMKPDVSYCPPVLRSTNVGELSKDSLPLQDGDDVHVQPDWEQQQQYAFQQQLQQFRRQQGIYSKSRIDAEQQHIHLHDRQERPNFMTSSFPPNIGTEKKKGDQDYPLPTVTPLAASATARGSSTFPRVAFTDLEGGRHFQASRGKHEVAGMPLRGISRSETHEYQWEDDDAAKKSKSKVPDNWIRFGAEAATTEEETDTAAAVGATAGRIAATLDGGEAWICPKQRREKYRPDYIKKRWIQEHPEHQSFAALDSEHMKQQRQRHLKVTEDPPQTGTSSHTERVQQLLRQRRHLQQQRQRLLKQERHRSARDLESDSTPPTELSPLRSAGVQAIQQRGCAEDNVRQDQVRRQQLRQAEQARGSRQKQRLPRERLQARDDSEAQEQQSHAVKEKECVYPVAPAAATLQRTHTALGADHGTKGVSLTASTEYELPVANGEAIRSPQENMSGKSSSTHSRLEAGDVSTLEQRQPAGVDSTGSSSAAVVASVSIEEAQSGAVVPSREAEAAIAAEAGATVDKHTTPDLEVAAGAKVDEAKTTPVQEVTTLVRCEETKQRRQKCTHEAHDTAAAAAAAHIAAIAATKAARAADTAIAVLAAASGGTPLNVLTPQQQHQQQRELRDRYAGSGNALSSSASKQLPVRYTGSEEGEPEETRPAEVERGGYPGAVLARPAVTAVDAGGSIGAQGPERRASLRRQSCRSSSAAPGAAALVDFPTNAALLTEEDMNKYRGGVGTPKAAATATAAASAAAAEAARESARRAAANIQKVAAVVADPLQPLQQLFSFCTGGSNTVSRNAAADKREVPTVVNTTCNPEDYYSYGGIPSSVQQPLVLRYWYNIPAQTPQPRGGEQQQVRSYHSGSPSIHSGEPTSAFCQRRADAPLEVPASCEREVHSRGADTPCWRTRSVASATRRRNKQASTTSLYDYPIQRGLYTASPQTILNEVHS